jgi:protein-disulfide isomerase
VTAGIPPIPYLACAQDVEGAEVSRVSGTPTCFINGRRHHGAYDIDPCRA